MARRVAISAFVLTLLLGMPLAGVGDKAYWLEVACPSYDEECMIYCLQGIVNRDEPTLFLDTGSIFWQYPPSDQFWLKYLAEKKGFEFEQIPDLRRAIARFRDRLKGLVVYDSSEDATRYVALTMAAQRDLIPVTDDILSYRTPALTEGANWTADDMTQPGPWRAKGVRRRPVEAGLEITEVDPALHYGAITRVIELDLSRTPLVEIDIQACTGAWVLKLNEGKPVDTAINADCAETGAFRFDLRTKLATTKGRFKVRIFTVGEGSALTVGGIRLLGPDGDPAPALPGDDVDCFAGMPIVEDLRGRFDDDLAAYEWALGNLMPECNKSLVFSAGHSHGDTYIGGDPAITIGLDYPIARKAFVYSLAVIDRPWHRDGRPVPGYPEQAAMTDRILQSLDRPAGVFGWAEPEGVYCDRVTSSGNFVVCAGAPNLSFWAHVPVAEPPRLPTHPARTKRLESKYYITFQTNEGDTPKIVAGLMSGGWLSEQRGSVPIAWGINPYIAERFPALFEFYASTATANDTFFAGCSGAGYCYPWKLPNFEDYARNAGRLLSAHGPSVIDVWEGRMRLDMYERYQRLTGAPCFTQQTIGAATNNWLDDGTPIITAARSLFYYRLDRKDPIADLEGRIRAVAATREPPYFILCYGGVGSGVLKYANEMVRRLPVDRFEVVGIDDMATLARQAGAFSVHVDGLGLSPGEKVPVEITLRNPDGDLGDAGTVTWTLAPGWSATEESWAHDSVATGQALRHTVTLTAGPDRGRARVVFTDSRSGQTRAAGIDVYAETVLVGDFSSTGGWQETGASLAVENGLGKITTPGRFASVRKAVTIDFDRRPVLEISVPRAEGAWALKVNDQTLPMDISLQRDTRETGRYMYDLPNLVGWQGRKLTEVILFAIGEGQSVYIDDVKVRYRN